MAQGLTMCNKRLWIQLPPTCMSFVIVTESVDVVTSMKSDRKIRAHTDARQEQVRAFTTGILCTWRHMYWGTRLTWKKTLINSLERE